MHIMAQAIATDWWTDFYQTTSTAFVPKMLPDDMNYAGIKALKQTSGLCFLFATSVLS